MNDNLLSFEGHDVEVFEQRYLIQNMLQNV